MCMLDAIVYTVTYTQPKQFSQLGESFSWTNNYSSLIYNIKSNICCLPLSCNLSFWFHYEAWSPFCSPWLSTLGIIEKYICIYFCSLLIITLFDRWTGLKATNEHLHNPMPSMTVIFSFQTWIPACWRRKLMIFIKFNKDSTWFVRYMGINNESWL